MHLLCVILGKEITIFNLIAIVKVELVVGYDPEAFCKNFNLQTFNDRYFIAEKLKDGYIVETQEKHCSQQHRLLNSKLYYILIFTTTCFYTPCKFNHSDDSGGKFPLIPNMAKCIHTPTPLFYLNPKLEIHVTPSTKLLFHVIHIQ